MGQASTIGLDIAKQVLAAMDAIGPKPEWLLSSGQRGKADVRPWNRRRQVATDCVEKVRPKPSWITPVWICNCNIKRLQ